MSTAIFIASGKGHSHAPHFDFERETPLFAAESMDALELLYVEVASVDAVWLCAGSLEAGVKETTGVVDDTMPE